MSAIPVCIKAEPDGTLTFGDFEAKEKQKVNGFEHGGATYSVRTHRDVTRVEKNGKLLVESVPGASFHSFAERDGSVTFGAEGFEDAQLTLELEPNTEYEVIVDEAPEGLAKANVSGKITFSLELGEKRRSVKVARVNG